MEIVRCTPSEMMEAVSKKNSSERDLVLAGYDLTRRARLRPAEAANIEYNVSDNRGDVFVAREEGRAVGSITVIYWRDDKHDKRGKHFWPQLQRTAPEIAQRAADENPLAIDIGGIVTHPDVRGTGVARQIYEKICEDANPTFILGQTKTPGAVMVRSTLPPFRTFYSLSEVTPDHPQERTDDHTPILHAYLYAREEKVSESTGYVSTHSGGIAPTISDMSNYPSIIRVAFEPVHAAQLLNRKTMLAPHISVKRSVLPLI